LPKFVGFNAPNAYAYSVDNLSWNIVTL